MYYNGTEPLDIGGPETCTLSTSATNGVYKLVVQQPPNSVTYDATFTGDTVDLASESGQHIVTLTRLGSASSDHARSSDQSTSKAPSPQVVSVSLQPVVNGPEQFQPGCPMFQTSPAYQAVTDVGRTACYAVGPPVLTLDPEAKVSTQMDPPAVVINLSPVQSDSWARYTAAHIGSAVAIVADGSVVTAPSITQAISGGKLVVSGMDPEKAAQVAQQLGG